MKNLYILSQLSFKLFFYSTLFGNFNIFYEITKVF